MKSFNDWMEGQRDVWSVTRDILGDRGDSVRTEVIFDNLWSEKDAWETGLNWLKDRGWDYTALDLRKNGVVVDMISWEP